MDQKSQDTPIADDLLLGAGPISEFLYGTQDRRRDVYRNTAGLTFFRHGAAIAAFKSTLRAEMTAQEEAAREALRQKKMLAATVPVKPPKRRGRACRAGIRNERAA